MKKITIKKLIKKAGKGKNFIVQVSQKESKKFQKLLFSKTDIRWIYKKGSIQLTKKKYLQVLNRKLTWIEASTDSPDYQIKSKASRITIEDLVKLDPKINWVVKVNPKTSKLLQEALFKAGYSWAYEDTSVKYIYASYLIKSIFKDSFIKYGDRAPFTHTKYKLIVSDSSTESRDSSQDFPKSVFQNGRVNIFYKDKDYITDTRIYPDKASATDLDRIEIDWLE